MGFNGSTEDYFPTNYKNPHIIAWNFSVQQSLPSHFTMDVAYVGNHGVDMGSSQNINASPVIAPASAGDTAYLPYFPHTGNVTQYFVPVSSMYNALQVKIDRRFAGGLSITSSFSYQKGMAYYNGGDDDGFYGFYLNGQYHRNWGLNDFNRTVTFVQSYVYQLPFGKGKQFLSSGSRALRHGCGRMADRGHPDGHDRTSLHGDLQLDVLESDPRRHQYAGSRWLPSSTFCTESTPPRTVDSLGSIQPRLPRHPASRRRLPRPARPVPSIRSRGAAQQVGNVGRNSMIGPGFFNLNAALAKTFAVQRTRRACSFGWKP